MLRQRPSCGVQNLVQGFVEFDDRQSRGIACPGFTKFLLSQPAQRGASVPGVHLGQDTATCAGLCESSYKGYDRGKFHGIEFELLGVGGMIHSKLPSLIINKKGPQ